MWCGMSVGVVWMLVWHECRCGVDVGAAVILGDTDVTVAYIPQMLLMLG